MATAAVAASLVWSGQLAAQDQQDLQRMIEDALDATDEAVTPAPELLADIDPELLFTDAELDELVAPVALYPDALLAQVLVAATYPLQIVQADRLLADSETMTDDELTEAIEARDWDPSVLVLLTGFPEVIRRMAEDLDDTERLGVAMGQQDEDVLDSVQRLRLQAEATGYLADNEAQVVEREGDRIVIEPADPDVIYVPRYDERLAFTQAPTQAPVIQPPGSGFGLGNPLVAGAIGFGSALLVNELFGDDDSDSGNNNNKNGWNNYWRNDRRAIDWREREIYPRAYGWDDNVERRREAAWSRERDRYWDQQGRRWRAEAERDRRDEWRASRGDRDWDIRRDPRTGEARVRLRDWSEVRAAAERRENVRDRQRARDAEAERDAARRAAQARDRDRAAEERAAAARREERADDEARRRQAAERERDAERREAREAEPSAQRTREAAEQRRRQEAEREREATRSEREARERRAERAAEERQAAERNRAEREAAEARREEENRRERQAAQRQEAEQAEAREAAAARREAAAREREAAQREAAVREREAQARSRDAAQRQAREQEQQAEQAARARQQQQRQADEGGGQRQQQRAGRDCPEGPEGRACRRGQ